jgi:hypothetical protein
MKKLFLLSAFVLTASGAFAQTAKYAELLVYHTGLNLTKFTAEFHVDGKKKTSQTVIRDPQGNKMKFGSAADALNFVTDQGWELVSTYGQKDITHFILKKAA